MYNRLSEVHECLCIAGVATFLNATVAIANVLGSAFGYESDNFTLDPHFYYYSSIFNAALLRS